MKGRSLPAIKMHHRWLRLAQLCLACIAVSNMHYKLYADNNIITVYPNEETGMVNKKVLGNNFLGYAPKTYENPEIEYWGYSDYGAGIWNPKQNEPVKEAINLAKLSGIRTARFPGGCGAHHYHWKESIGKKRKHFLYGIDEFLRTCELIGAAPVLTLSYFTGSEQDAGDLVEYLNSPDDGRHIWAQKRAENGHPQPYGMKYFEFGNEDWHGDHKNIKEVAPEEYAHNYLKFYAKMKAKDPSIMLGAILCGFDSAWDKKVLGILKDKIDFASLHFYPLSETGDEQIKKMNPRDIFTVALALPAIQYEECISKTAKLLRRESGRDIPLAITEYNVGITQGNPLPYRHSLGTALTNAELLRIFMKPGNNILMANYWNFINEYWGMVYTKTDFTNGDIKDSKNYIKRPNYFVFELYNRCFGDILIKTDVECETFTIDRIHTEESIKSVIARVRNVLLGKNVKAKEIPAGLGIQYLAVNASKNNDGTKIYLMVINKNLDTEIICRIHLKDFISEKICKAWILNGPHIDSTNEEDADNVAVAYSESNVEADGFRFAFQPHSLTALEIKGKASTLNTEVK